MTLSSAVAPDERSWRIEPMRWWHIPRAAELETVLFPVDSPWTAAMFWAELAAGHHYIVASRAIARRAVARGVAADGSGPDGPAESTEQDSVILGYAGLAVGLDDADVQTIGVAPAAQSRGIGRALFNELLRAAGGQPVHLEVRTDNAAAIALYESEGFQRIGLRRRYYQPSGADAYLMLRPAQ
ncbi:MAG: ribosomal protein S18-alanine N-acetyltransferase [Nakamurella sp.]